MSIHPFQNDVLAYIRRQGLIRKGEHLLAGVSGGADSITLLDVLLNLQPFLKTAKISILHFNHQLRGEESDADEAFVEQLAKEREIPFYTSTKDVSFYARKHRISIEMAARTCRLEFFRDHLKLLHAHKIALAHTANDQAEEVLLRLFRGTGPSGLVGMTPKTDRNIIRPLLFASRTQILAYLEDRELGYRNDSSNLEPMCQRNKLRLNVIPILEKIHGPSLVQIISRNADLLRDEEEYWEQQVQEKWPSICKKASPSELILDISGITPFHISLQRRVIRQALERLRGNLLGFYAIHLEAIRDLILRPGNGRIIDLPDGLRATREAGYLRLSSREEFEAPRFEPVNIEHKIDVPGVYKSHEFDLHLSFINRIGTIEDEIIKGPPNGVLIDASKIVWPLALRYWQPGDRFQPLGLTGTKKLQDFFTDLKVPRSFRNHIPLLVDGEKICWVIGYRLDNRVKVSKKTNRILIVEQILG